MRQGLRGKKRELGVQKSLGPMLCGWNLRKFGLGKVNQNRKLRLNFPIPSRNPCAIRNPCHNE